MVLNVRRQQGYIGCHSSKMVAVQSDGEERVWNFVLLSDLPLKHKEGIQLILVLSKFKEQYCTRLWFNAM